mmetsp:Transcript_15608/g.25858  ORF Transcript_15608/g.25858 Transcript_15608/m.25858 type:complete len:520 (+) Transcript_15608:107-1666(+)
MHLRARGRGRLRKQFGRIYATYFGRLKTLPRVLLVLVLVLVVNFFTLRVNPLSLFDKSSEPPKTQSPPAEDPAQAAPVIKPAASTSNSKDHPVVHSRPAKPYGRGEATYFQKVASEGCKDPAHRDFEKDPVLILTGTIQPENVFWHEPCDVGCAHTADTGLHQAADGLMDVIPGGTSPGNRVCPYQQRILFSMESLTNYPNLKTAKSDGDYDIVATFRLDSDVPAPYFDWPGYNIFEPISEKTDEALAAAFISNCGASNGRLQWLKGLMENGVKIHSYGACLRNKQEPPSNKWRFNAKVDLARKYRFTIAFENSDEPYYVTEKPYQALIAGSVPIFMGGSNMEHFFPTRDSFIQVRDFETPKALAEHILALAANEEEYQNRLAWKTQGTTQDFRSLVADVNNVSSSCRLCIFIADQYRWNHGATTLPPLSESPHPYVNTIRTRERGKFWFSQIFLSDWTYEELILQCARAFDRPVSDVYGVTDAKPPRRMFVQTDDLSKLLKVRGAEVEVIFKFAVVKQ